ncbi:uncharacterized protein A4U43_C01F15350 [Asparagus officinalis]|uniref:Uncharacterized protein n=1 Tax=Asparagus officinalis TaxID=4686 RepID=A0A5P1FU68_ASPOF|nr:uncharacterized protein A4U43_C01F15350 [Asparagus officinalis]
MQEPKTEPLVSLGKEHISLEHKDSDDKEKLDYEANTDTYFTEPDGTGFKGDVVDSSYMPNDEPKLASEQAAPHIHSSSCDELLLILMVPLVLLSLSQLLT